MVFKTMPQETNRYVLKQQLNMIESTPLFSIYITKGRILRPQKGYYDITGAKSIEERTRR